MKNSKGSNSIKYRIFVSFMMVLFFLQIGILTALADDLVREAQETMVEKGINPGPIDGIWGPLTRGGVIEFQKREGLTVSGRLDPATKLRLFSTPEAPSSKMQEAKEPAVEKTERTKAPEVKQEEIQPKAEEVVKAPKPVVPSAKAPSVAPAPEAKKEVSTSIVKSSGICPQRRKTKSAPAHIAKLDKTGSANLENGKKLYTKSAKPLACKQCHGDQGDGKGKLGAVLKPSPRNFTCDDTMKDISVGQMFWIIKNGSTGSGMVAHKKSLKDSEIWDLVEYIRTTFMAESPSEKEASLPSKISKSSAAQKVPAPVKSEPAKPVEPESQVASQPADLAKAVSQLPKGVIGKGKYEETTVSDGGSISGVIHFNGKAPAAIMEDLNKGKNVEFCATHPDTVEDNVRPRIKVVVTQGKLKDTVVFIQNIEKGKAWPTAVTNFDFKICDIFPKVSVVRKTPKGMKTGLLTITNQDAEILHNPHGYSIAGANRKTLFNKPLPSQGAVADVTKNFKRFKPKKDKHFFLQCDQHNFMEADARVVWNPYHSISGSDGAFKIDQIPAGKYWLTAWHPYLGEVSREVTVAGGTDVKSDFELSGNLKLLMKNGVDRVQPSLN